MQVMKYTKDLLEEILSSGNATAIDSYPKYTQRLRVTFRCECGTETSKRFEMLNVHRLPYCEGCSLKKKEERKQASNLAKYGVTNTGQLPEIKKKIQETYIKTYGGHPKQTHEVQDKWKATCLDKYGGHPNQNKEVQIKTEANAYAYKEYTLPSGNQVKVQGYESLALDDLVKLYPEESICIGRANIPSIDYTIDGKKHVYFPDFFIPSENKIIEVKSEWTLQLKKGNVEEKALATVNAGYAYEIWVYNGKGKVETKVYPQTLPVKEDVSVK